MTRRFPPVTAIVFAASALLLAQSSIPSPEAVLGFVPGTDYRLASYDQVVDYFKRVDAASDRVRMFEAGTSTQGRTFHFALVSSKRNLDRLDRYREIARRLAHPEGLTDADARRLAAEGRAFVHIDGGLHSTEVAGPQHTPLLLHELVSRAGDPEIEAMLDQVIVMLWPTINPDGHQMVADAYATRTNPGAGSAPLAGLYQEFVGHDNNRDAYMLNMIESRVMEHTWRQWEPSIIYVHHQSAPFPTRIWLPPFAEPIATHAPYVISRQLNMIGMAIAQRLDQEGKVGATHMGTGYDAWYPGYIDYAPVFKNIPAFWTETQGNGAAPTDTAADRVPANMQRPQSLYASPWMGGTWTLRDAVEYMKTASIATIEYAGEVQDRAALQPVSVRPRSDRTRRRHRALRLRRPAAAARPGGGRRTAAPAGVRRCPRGAVHGARRARRRNVPRRDLVRARRSGVRGAGARGPRRAEVPGDSRVARRAARHAVRRGRLDAAALDGRSRRPAVEPASGRRPPDAPPPVLDRRGDQARAVPSDGRRRRGAVRQRAGPRLRQRSRRSPDPAAARRPHGRGTGARRESGGEQRVSCRQPRVEVRRRRRLLARRYAGRVTLRRHRSLARRAAGTRDVARAARRAHRGGRRPAHAAHRPLRQSDRHGQRLDALGARAVRLRLRPRDRRRSPGRRPARSPRRPAPHRRCERARWGGRGRGAGAVVPPAAAATQGVSAPPGPPVPPPPVDPRVRAIDEFVRRGGTLVCFNRAGNFAIDQLKLPVRNVVAGLNRTQFFVGGSLLKVTTNPAHPVMAGMPVDAAVYYDSGPVFEPTAGFSGALIASYPTDGSPLLSGFLQGGNHLHGKAAAVDVHHGDGHVVLLGFRPQWRGQPFGTFRIIFNALLYGN